MWSSLSLCRKDQPWHYWDLEKTKSGAAPKDLDEWYEVVTISEFTHDDVEDDEDDYKNAETGENQYIL